MIVTTGLVTGRSQFLLISTVALMLKPSPAWQHKPTVVLRSAELARLFPSARLIPSRNSVVRAMRNPSPVRNPLQADVHPFSYALHH
jgi:hypothetical protein